MSDAFLEEQISGLVRYGASYGDEYKVDISVVKSGRESRRLCHPIPIRYYLVDYVTDADEMGAKFLDLYHRAFGMYAGFRVKISDDYTTNNHIDPPTSTDQLCELVSAGVYQLQKEYGQGSTPLNIGRPKRTIYKPVAGTVLVAITNTNSGTHNQTITTHWTVDTTTGLVTFAANKTDAIEGITLGATTVIQLTGHAYNVGDSVHFSGIVGTTELNGYRTTVSAKTTDTITVPINSTSYTAWVSGGTVNTRPQTGETVKAGCEFDVPMRFNTRVDIQYVEKNIRAASGIELIELIGL